MRKVKTEESFNLTEVLFKDGNMKNGVAILPLAVADLMFNVTASNVAFGMKGVEGPLLPMPRCFEQRGLSIYVSSTDQFRILVYQKLARLRLAQQGREVERILLSMVGHLSYHMGIDNLQKLLHNIDSTVGYSNVQGCFIGPGDLGRLDRIFALSIFTQHSFPIAFLDEAKEFVF